ncbi:class I SAM-dependent methyltransferase [Sphingomonas sp. LaA6.9]|uniref:class I SAM-dependent methyltransferase n=1 Tax=Sphingomonas sp. LaA6.9 TaxID=2919914 RepID=UPI001F4FE492|nr:methyltransferase [Sphingomonas sp. LaA6.9]MCJ8155795.1 methyltransferase [Sphingomonas sp. LaA6.9]
MKLMIVPIVAALALAHPIAAKAQNASPEIQAALADAGRPADDKVRDAARHPGEILAFAGIKPGDKVADFMMGGGYWTRILAKTVGDKGHVYGYQAKQFIDYRAAYAEEQKAAVAGHDNVTPSSDSLASFSFPEPLDAVITVQNWHDLHLAFAPKGFAETVARRLYDTLKPGGVLLVVDHVAAADPDFAVPDKLHRIDPAAARAEIEKAGFRFDGELNLLRNPADPHTANVFDASIKGRTDQFVYRFRKPG